MQRIGDKPLSAAEKQRRYRVAQKNKFKELQSYVANGIIEPAEKEAIREDLKKELKESWEPLLLAERMAAERKKGRELALKADHNFENGRITGICATANYFIGKERADIANALLAHFMIDKDTAKAVLEADKRTKSLTLESLERAGVWNIQETRPI